MNPRHWGNLVLVVLAAGYAFVAFANGRDRDSVRQEVSGRLVPDMLRAQLHRQDVRHALQEGRIKDAAVSAARAVRREPVEPGSTSALAAALFAKKDYAGADRAFRVAGKFGWRDTPTQAYLLLAALAFDERAAAAQRLDAIMRVDPDSPAGLSAVTAIEGDARGRTALLGRLAERPGWIASYAASAAKLPGPAFANRLALLEQSAASGNRAACGRIADAVNDLAYQQGRYDEARRLWAVACADPGDRGALANGSFDRALAEPVTPFDWNLPGAGGVSAAIANGNLIAQNDDLIRHPVAHQYLLLQPGETVIAWEASASGDKNALADAVRLLCPNGSYALSQLEPAAGGYARRYTIPLGCRPQRLEVVLDRNAGESRIEAITVASAGAPLP